ncbi:hypothetical protein KN1_00620 [Stygiolobus caldivivus]|uniref:Uncharacterized protein n=1 Tax=Stygiolobus caldivivus TaxID=2824673 RepID=A0A8D5U457_9CREN|nr:hypothetical protein KN1_00620 [Stygiolobus caldivivus]
MLSAYGRATTEVLVEKDHVYYSTFKVGEWAV